jgi:hypothetical protein
MATGTYQCPICGKGTPHAHENRAVEVWLQSQAARFGFHVRAFPTVELRDGFIKEAIRSLEESQNEWHRSAGYDLQGYTDATDALKEYAAHTRGIQT